MGAAFLFGQLEEREQIQARRSPSPTRVYHRRKHVIGVTAVLAPDSGEMAPRLANAAGYNLVQWIDGGVAYWAVSDLNAQELGEFVRLFRSG